MKLSEIKRLMAPVMDLSLSRGSFKIGDLEVRVRTTLPVEDVKIHRWAIDAAADDEGMVDSRKFIDAFRDYLIATCITHLGDVCVEDQEFLETGDTLPDGTPIKVSRVDAIYRMVSEWGREFQILAFLKIYDITALLELKQKSLVNYEPVDLEVEIKQLEGRIKFLQQRVEERKDQAMNTRKIDLDRVRNFHLALEDEAPPAEDPAPEVETKPDPEPAPTPAPVEEAPPTVRPLGSLIPDSAPPPEELSGEAPVPPPVENPRYDLSAPSSLMTSGSEEDEILAESHRIMARRQAAMQQENTEAGLVFDGAPQGRSNPRFRK